MKIEDEIKSKFRSELQKALVNIRYTHNFLANDFMAVLKPYNLSETQFNVLRILRGQYPNTSSIGLIKDRMLDKNSDVSRVIDRMLVKNLVVRKECQKDRRQKDIIITQSALDILSEIDKHDTLFDEKLKHFSEKDAVLLNNLLDKLRN